MMMPVLRSYVDAASGQEGNASLRVTRLVLGQELKLVVLIFEVTDVAITVINVSLAFP